jgi:hypothetical protein
MLLKYLEGNFQFSLYKSTEKRGNQGLSEAQRGPTKVPNDFTDRFTRSLTNPSQIEK